VRCVGQCVRRPVNFIRQERVGVRHSIGVGILIANLVQRGEEIVSQRIVLVISSLCSEFSARRL
jgi:hypothetical protein